MIDSRQLECFIAVAEELNLGRAAMRLHMTQPPLTRRIHRLEQEVNAELFSRVSAGMELTESGAVLLERAYRIVALSKRAVERTQLARDGELGHISIGYYDSAILDGIPRLMRDFTGLHPEVTFSFELVAKHRQIDYLRDKLLHIGFGRDYPNESGIVRRTVLSEPLYVAIHERRLPDWRSPAKVADLADQPLIVYPATRASFADVVIDMCLREGFTPSIRIEAEDVISCLAYVAVGIGIAVVPQSATKSCTDGVTFIPLIGGSSAELNCVLLAANSSPTLALFVEHLSSRNWDGPA
jgi:LysR family transcriptional regulator, benzoate and cis,cis-muconate-responsive activator of ben and cat genes